MFNTVLNHLIINLKPTNQQIVMIKTILKSMMNDYEIVKKPMVVENNKNEAI
jgi:hypothetical protein